MKKIYIPSNLNLPDLLPPQYNNDKDLDRLHYIIHLIYEQRILCKITQEYVPLKAAYLRHLIVRNYNDYVKVLVFNGIIQCDNHFIKGEKSYGYKLSPSYTNVKHREIEFRTSAMQANLEKWRIRRLPKTKVHLYLYEMLEKIEIDYENASSYVSTFDTEEYNYAKIAIDKFKNKDFFLCSDEFGRVHTNITNLKSTLRKYLRYKGENLYNVDIINSQPLLLIPSLFSSILCTSAFYFEDIPTDLLVYKRLVENGELYDFMMKHSGDTDRAVFKEKFFRETFFGKKTSKLFCQLFPTVAEKLLKVKKKDYRKLAWNMQKTESKLMITKICGRIMEELPDVFIATIHDSILTTQENVTKIRRIISDEFGKYGLSPTIRIEPT